jgi:hypothetical protein
MDGREEILLAKMEQEESRSTADRLATRTLYLSMTSVDCYRWQIVAPIPIAGL